MNPSFEFGDRILVSGPSLTADTEGIFISMTNNTLTWVSVATTGIFTGQPTLFRTDVDAHSIQKLT